PTLIYDQVDRFVTTLKCTKIRSLNDKEEHDDVEGDYAVDEKAKVVNLTPRGIEKAEKTFAIENLTDPENTTLFHHINQAIRAHGIMQRDVDYVVREGEIIIVDEFTGRLMVGRRYSEGLHQAIEAKEHVNIQRESKTLATITFQNYFRLYDKLSGMTGTALTEEEEFKHIYKLDVIEIPTNKPMVRKDLADVVYKNEPGKFRAVVAQIEECAAREQPVLVGTISIEKSELIAEILKKKGVKHVVLNAKHHDKEAEIVAQAGHAGAVTIATNMAGRGTDIMLGGNAEYMAKSDLRKSGMSEELIVDAGGSASTDDAEILAARAQYQELYRKYKPITDSEAEKVRAAGGLFIIGTERHESRRIDNQLRGRAGRQGDPGSSRFFISLEDDIMRLFGSERIMNMMESLGLDEDTPIEQKMLTNAIESAQKRVESKNFGVRKNVLEYDDVMNKQREIIYGQRKRVLDGDDLRGAIIKMVRDDLTASVTEIMRPEKYVQVEHLQALRDKYFNIFLTKNDFDYTVEQLTEWDFDSEKLIDEAMELAEAAYNRREEELTPEIMRELERVILLRTVDEHWMDHIDAMHELRQGIGLSAYAQRDPIIEYKNQGHDMFDQMIASICEQTVRMIYTVRIQGEDAPKREKVAKITGESAGDETLKKEPIKKGKKVGRNDPCPCGSGLKYKKCCGKDES
ncbi:MAG: SEC-C metal-binding domain-containing protein, partial [Clostridia bacterium]